MERRPCTTRHFDGGLRAAYRDFGNMLPWHLIGAHECSSKPLNEYPDAATDRSRFTDASCTSRALPRSDVLPPEPPESEVFAAAGLVASDREARIGDRGRGVGRLVHRRVDDSGGRSSEQQSRF